MKRPTNEEHIAYYGKYVNLVPEGDLLLQLSRQMEETVQMLSGLTEEQENYRYAPGKWSVKEVLGHLIDTERIMSYRLLRIARGDQTPLAGYDDEAYVAEGEFSSRRMSELLDEYKAVRQSTIAMFKGVPARAWERTGVANNSHCSARALAYIIAGHELHHGILLKDRYQIG
ncbi:DinB family protein [Brevibacillus brevis]|uniref:DinB family protein n=1 Tax=Brevibacillus brevis TaxID=1393 RepID=A0ABY9T2V6_BREBE|nr:DinB family protein [Brevibacillus brevis]WNC12733.1 DinB family protein [Brevibacillus brevis]